MADELFNMIQDAYIRGATWYRKNDDFGSMLHKAAYDYADKMTSTMTIETELPAVKVEWSEPPLTCPHIDKAVASGVLPEDVISELDEIRDINSQLRYGTWYLHSKATDAESRCEELVKALEFYADELTWSDTNPKDDGRLTVLVPSPSFAEIDRGKLARAALKELGKGDGR